MKEKLVIILGAGASLAAGVPSTQQLTDLLLASDITFGEPLNMFFSANGANNAFPVPLMKQIRVCKSIFKGLKGSLECPNFEHVLAAMEELQAIANSQESIGIKDKFSHVLAPFVRIDSLFERISQPGFLSFARREVIKLISSKIQNALSAKHNPAANVNNFIAELKKHFHLRVLTLNYDDLFDQATDWYDGFEKHGENDFAVFNPRHFLEYSRNNDRDLLLHLHGSIRFGYPFAQDALSVNPLQLLKFDNAQQALKTLDQGRSDTIDQGTLISAPPIISGFHKIAKLAHSPVPYGYYYKALIEEMLSTDRLLVIGYGGGDEYLNTWIEQYVANAGRQRRAAYVSRCEPVHVAEPSMQKDLMMLLAGAGEFSEYFAYAGDQLPRFQQHGNLGLCTAGFPLDSETQEQLIEFLSCEDFSPKPFSLRTAPTATS